MIEKIGRGVVDIPHWKLPVCRFDHLAHEIPISHTITLSRTRLPLSRTRFQSRSRWVFCCKWSKIDWMSMNKETARAGIRVRKAEKAHNIRTFSHGRGAKKKDPNCIIIRVLLWCGRWDLNPYACAHAPQTCLSANSSTTAHHVIISKETESVNTFSENIFAFCKREKPHERTRLFRLHIIRPYGIIE